MAGGRDQATPLCEQSFACPLTCCRTNERERHGGRDGCAGCVVEEECSREDEGRNGIEKRGETAFMHHIATWSKKEPLSPAGAQCWRKRGGSRAGRLSPQSRHRTARLRWSFSLPGTDAIKRGSRERSCLEMLTVTGPILHSLSSRNSNSHGSTFTNGRWQQGRAMSNVSSVQHAIPFSRALHSRWAAWQVRSTFTTPQTPPTRTCLCQ